MSKNIAVPDKASRSHPRARESRRTREPAGLNGSVRGSSTNLTSETPAGIIRQPQPLMRSSREVLAAMGLPPR